MKKGLFVYLALLCHVSSHSQNKLLSFETSNQVTSFPLLGFGRVFSAAYHPGAGIEYQQRLTKKERNQWWFIGSFSGFHHSFFQTAFLINSGISYKYKLTELSTFFTGVDGGYLHSFYKYDRFRLQSDGTYEKASIINSRAQFNIGLHIGYAQDIKPKDPGRFFLFVKLKTFTQGLFAGSYIPIVPYNSFSIGLITSLNSNK